MEQRRNVSVNALQRQQQRATLSSSLACATITAMPSGVTTESDSQLRPIGSDSSLMARSDESHRRRTRDTAFTAAGDGQHGAANQRRDAGVGVQPEDARPLDDGAV